MEDEKRIYTQDPSSVMPGGKLKMVRKYGKAPVKDDKGHTKEHIMYYFIVETADGQHWTVPWCCVQSHEQYIDKAIRRMIPLGMPPTEGGEKDAEDVKDGEVRPVAAGSVAGEAAGDVGPEGGSGAGIDPKSGG